VMRFSVCFPENRVSVGLVQCDRAFELRNETWALANLFDEQPITVVHLLNPFFTDSRN
jgi:hypothetical protein